MNSPRMPQFNVAPATSTTTSQDNVSTSSSFVYPRTGKRGVPQQFPRRLYEMLESETKLSSKIISWSPSGKAFGIVDVPSFTSQVLGKYFRTSKFSSFQRNLNLYGFAKVRRGPDADMYAHPSFLRGHPKMLMQLRKCNTVAVRRRLSSSSETSTLSEVDGSSDNSVDCSLSSSGCSISSRDKGDDRSLSSVPIKKRFSSIAIPTFNSSSAGRRTVSPSPPRLHMDSEPSSSTCSSKKLIYKNHCQAMVPGSSRCDNQQRRARTQFKGQPFLFHYKDYSIVDPANMSAATKTTNASFATDSFNAGANRLALLATILESSAPCPV